ncbi:MAG: type I restriction-modification system subunit M N-terminal domain-containing protein [Syntrophobacteraceae bacterium]|nr:type I restriction-modification system subunit M N-terminal domain-containing protein [Syntrophobacteraceae bacterium]
MDLSFLANHLWESANILRGPVDAADFKTFIFPLLFFKRISDVYDEEYAAALAESGGDEEYAQFPQNYRFQIPKGCQWGDVRVVTTTSARRCKRQCAVSRRRTLRRFTVSSAMPPGPIRIACPIRCSAI